MRLPTYENQVRTPNAPQYSAMADLRTAGNLGELADGLNQYREYRQKELEEAQKTEWYKADNGFRLDMANAKSEMVNSIQNGGSYADAEAKFQKTYEDTKAKYMPFFGADENVAARQAADFERVGLEGLLNIREAVQQRRKGDAIQSSELTKMEALNLFVDDPQKALDMYSRSLSGLQASGAVSSDGAKARLISFVQDGKSKEMDLVFQNNVDNPQAALDWVEANKSDLGVDNYLSGREKAQNEIFKFGSAQKVKNYIADPVTYKAPDQESIDVFYERELAPILASGDQAGYEEAVVATSVNTGKIPSSVTNQAAAYLDMEATGMNQSDLNTVAMNARIISETSKYAAKVNMKDLTKDTIAKSNLLVQRMNAGMDVQRALTSVQRDLGSEESKKMFNQAGTEARNILLEKKVNGQKIKTNLPKYAEAEFIAAYQNYRMNTGKPSEAAKAAIDEVSSRYKEFNGTVVKDPVTSVSQFDEKSWVAEANSQYTSRIGAIPNGAKIAVVIDGESNRMLNAGERPSFPLVVVEENSPPIKVFDKNGDEVRVFENPVAMSRQITRQLRRSDIEAPDLRTVRPSERQAVLEARAKGQ